MSYLLTVPCGCVVHIVSHPRTNHTYTRVVARRGPACFRPTHRVGARFFLWEMLPDSTDRAAVERNEHVIEWL